MKNVRLLWSDGLVLNFFLTYCSLFGEVDVTSDYASTKSNRIARGTAVFRAPCSCDSDCDFSKWLTCQNGFCNCVRTKTFVYDYNKDTCVVRLREKCFEITQEFSEYNIVDLPGVLYCIPGAFCSMSSGGLCACNIGGYYESLDGSACIPKKNFDDSCSRSVECRSEVCSAVDGGLGQCVCKSGEFYHKKRKKCLGLVSSSCFSDDQCTDNGICNEDARCQCRPGYSETVTKTCEIRLSYGDACNATMPCNNRQLTCINSKCDCKYYDHQMYVNSKGTCVSFANGPCEVDEDCMENSYCRSLGQFSECQCKENYLEMPNGYCLKYSRYGSLCESNNECDPIPPLVCKEGRCDCKDNLKVYDETRRACVGVHSSKCSLSSSISSNSQCCENAVCVQNNLMLPGKCICTGSRVTYERTCVLD